MKKGRTEIERGEKGKGENTTFQRDCQGGGDLLRDLINQP